MMGRRAYQVETSTAADASRRQAPLRNQGDSARRWRWPSDHARTVRHAAAVESVGRARFNGDATIEVPLNDSLTSFRIVAIAESGPDQFGTGFASIRSTQDLMLLSGVSPIIRNGDSFAAEFTVRNASERAFDATVNAKIDGLAQVRRRKSSHSDPARARPSRLERRGAVRSRANSSITSMRASSTDRPIIC